MGICKFRYFPEDERNAFVIGLNVERLQSAQRPGTLIGFQLLSTFQHEQCVGSLVEPDNRHYQSHAALEPFAEISRSLGSLRRMYPGNTHRGIDDPSLAHRRPSSIADFTSA